MATPAILQEQSAVDPSSPSEWRSPWWLGLHLLLFLLTLATTTMVGMRYMDNFRQGLFPLASDADIFPMHWVWANRAHWMQGLPFSLTLLMILLAHEWAHYAACRTFGINASLPYLIPAPSLSGTAGAIIRLRSSVKKRAALLWIGASGPIAGFAVALGTTAAGLRVSVESASAPMRLVELNSPLLLKLMGAMLHRPMTATLIWHPILVASWVGLLVTSLNLIPAGQLDGGHVLYALSPRIHRRVTNAMLIVLVVMGVFCWLGWLLWVCLLLLPGMRHPKMRDTTPLQPRLRWLAPICFGIFLLTATPMPFAHANLFQTFHWLTH
jgi:Zn-dependent protease